VKNSKVTNSSLLNFAKETLYLLAQDSTPEAARQDAVERAEAGEKITTKMGHSKKIHECR